MHQRGVKQAACQSRTAYAAKACDWIKSYSIWYSRAKRTLHSPRLTAQWAYLQDHTSTLMRPSSHPEYAHLDARISKLTPQAS